MTKQTMINNYRKFSAADAYILGFVYKHELYAGMIDEIPPRYMRVERESERHGGKLKLQLRLTNKDMQELINAGAYKIGNEDMLAYKKNRGVAFEELMYIINGQTPRKKDNVGFWVSGDININGKEVQIKLNGAQIVVESTLENLKKKARKKS